jgi:hypothetical protein
MDTMKFSVIMNQHPQDTNKVLKLHYYVNDFIIAGDRNKVNYINYYIIPDDKKKVQNIITSAPFLQEFSL